MSTNTEQPVVIRRKPRHRQKVHGAWKIAYADFMTAMMAFFLVMWLLAGMTTGQLNQISEYFRTPLTVALVGGDKNSASNSAIPGGGDDPMHSEGEKALTTPKAKNYHPKPSQTRLKRFQSRLQSMVHEDPTLKSLGSQLRIDLVQDGLRIQITDSKQRPMFRLGSARIEPRLRDVLDKIAPVLNEVPNRITITGHTDNLQYARGEVAYSNWELSAQRANASRRELIAGGMTAHKVLRVTGAADTMPLRGSKQGDPSNRRISILVLNEPAQARLETKQAGEQDNAGGDRNRPPPAPMSQLDRLLPGLSASQALEQQAITPAARNGLGLLPDVPEDALQDTRSPQTEDASVGRPGD